MKDLKADSIVVSDDHHVNEGADELHLTDVDENLLNVGGGEVMAENDNLSSWFDEERPSGQESVGGLLDIDDVNDEAKIQTNGTSILGEEDRGNNRDPSSSDKDSFSASIQKVGSGDHQDSLQFSSEPVNSDILLGNNSEVMEAGIPLLADFALSPSMPPASTNPPPTTSKGHGLKKWRRIKRENIKDGSSTLDSTILLKRGSGAILDKQPSDSSVSSTKAIADSLGHVDFFFHPVASSNYKLAVDTTFSAGTDDNDDKSSKSSTAASAPKHRHDAIRALGQREKEKPKHTSGKHFNSSGQKLQPGNGHKQADTSKKHRGENPDIEKENSLSSIESNSRSCGSVFTRGSCSVNIDQLQSGKLVNFDGEDAHDQQANEVQSAEELHSDRCKNGNLLADCSAEYSCSVGDGKSKNHHPSEDCEPLVNSILMLQSAHEALEKEIQLFKEIGKGIHSLCDDSGKAKSVSGSSKCFDPKSRCNSYSDNWGSDFDHVQTVKRQLEEATLMLKEKEVRLVELERITESMTSLQVDTRTKMELQHKRCQEMEAQLEGLLKHKIEAEVQYVTMTGFTKDFGLLIEDQNKLMEEQKTRASEQAESLRRMSEVISKAAVLQDEAEKLDTLVTDISEGDEIQKIRSKVSKFAWCFILQLILLVSVLGPYVSQFLPKPSPVVPT